MKAYWINATEKTVTAVEYSGLADMQRLVGGYIEVAKIWPSGDTLYVDEEGLLKAGAKVFFRIPDKGMPLSGNGVVVGREIGLSAKTRDPSITIGQLRAEITFLSTEEVAAWARANSSEPAVTFHFPEGSEVVTRTGQLFGVAPPKK